MTEPTSSHGPATDVENQPVVDPTRNVRELVDAAIQRQDDLRLAEGKHTREMAALRSEHASEVLELRARLGEKAERCAEEIGSLRAHHAEQLRQKEESRLDAIRRVDVEAAQRTAEVQAVAATVLEGTVAATAEAMRNQVATTATGATTALAAALQPIQKDIQDLREAQYQAQGEKTQVVERRASGSNVALWIGLGVSGFVLLLMMVGIIITIIVAPS